MRLRTSVTLLSLTLLVAVSPAGAVHFYRGSGGGCTPTEGALTDDASPSGPLGATVMLLHNTYNDTDTGLGITRIRAGESVTWTWNSAHCHSVTGANNAFDSGFHYPTPEPTSPRVVPGFFDYPVPESEAALSYTRTFTDPGVYRYSCVHHVAIGMAGLVVVE